MNKRKKEQGAVRVPLEGAWKPLTPEEEAILDQACSVQDEDIDFSEAPEITDEQWAQASRGNDLWRPRKVAVSARLDADVLLWLKRPGPGYLTRINQILRDAMNLDTASGR